MRWSGLCEDGFSTWLSSASSLLDRRRIPFGLCCATRFAIGEEGPCPLSMRCSLPGGSGPSRSSQNPARGSNDFLDDLGQSCQDLQRCVLHVAPSDWLLREAPRMNVILQVSVCFATVTCWFTGPATRAGTVLYNRAAVHRALDVGSPGNPRKQANEPLRP